MKRLLVLIGIVVLVALGLLIRFSFPSRTPSPILPDTNGFLENQNGTVSTSSPSPSRADQSSAPQETQMQSTNAPESLEANATRQFLGQFKVPIRFYGKVVDENDQPVSKAHISFKWNKVAADNKFETGLAQTETDGEGMFSLDGQESNGLSVEVNKPDYYAVGANPANFQYSATHGGNTHVPDPSNPVVFHLRKKGHGVALVTSRLGMRDDFSISIPRDGTPVKVDLLERKKEDGPLEISQLKPDPKFWKQAEEWSFEMTIATGGFVEYHDEQFPFEAPEGGYQPTVKFAFQKDQTNWTVALKKDYYIRFGTSPLYGRLHLETGIDGGARLTYAINPDGTRNLEPN